jgi:hypothetical protein
VEDGEGDDALERGRSIYGGRYQRPHMPDDVLCPTCGHELIQKNRMRLAISGLAFILVGVGLVLYMRAIQFALWHFRSLFLCIPVVVGLYLMAWAVDGQGLWCRTCKKWPTRKSLR